MVLVGLTRMTLFASVARPTVWTVIVDAAIAAIHAIVPITSVTAAIVLEAAVVIETIVAVLVAYVAMVKFAGAVGSGKAGTAVIHRMPLIAVVRGKIAMAILIARRLPAALAFPAHFVAVRASFDSAAAVEADAVALTERDTPFIDVMNHANVYVEDSAIVEKHAVSPFAAVKAAAGVAIPVVDSAIETHVGAPVAAMPNVKAVRKDPVARSPKKLRFGRQHPSSRDPIIAIGAIGPIAGNPNVAGLRANGLCVNRKGRRADADGNAYGYLCAGYAGNR